MNDRILVVRCSSDCRYLRGPIDPWDNKDQLYCAADRAWVSITKDDCASCKLKGRFDGVEIEKAITEVEKALKRYAGDRDVITERELAEIAINTLSGLNK